MTRAAAPGDEARASVMVGVEQALAFTIFTEEIDRWWRRGPRFRAAGKRRGIIHMESRLGGRLFESYESTAGTKVFEAGRITLWEPPTRLAFDWRTTNFAPSEKTEVEITFEARGDATLVSVVHRGWSAIRADHPARHGQDVAAFLRMNGLWWGALLTALREFTAAADD